MIIMIFYMSDLRYCLNADGNELSKQFDLNE